MAPLEPYPSRLADPDLTKRLPRGADAKRSFMAQWLAGKLEPGDRLVTGAEGIVGRPRAFEIATAAFAVSGLAGIYPGWPDWTSHASRLAHLAIFALLEATGAMALADVFTRRPVYLAVTERSVLVVRLDRSRHPVEILATVPIEAAWVTTKWRSVTLRAVGGSPLLVRGKARSQLRLGIRNWRAQRDATLAALAARGGMVNVPLVLGGAALSGPA